MAQTNQVEFLTPLGRLVQGSVWLLNETDREGNPLKTQDGKPKKQCFFALAVEKVNPEWPAFFARLAQVAQGGYPQFFDQNGNCVKQDFAWKISDGDGFDNEGKPNNAKPGWAGCWVVKFSSSFLPRCFEKNKYAPQQQLQDERAVKLGYFVRVGGLMQANIGSKKPGLYLNADLVELNYVGDEIMPANIRDASAALQAQQSSYVPAGAIQLGAGAPGMGGMAGTPQGAMAGMASSGMQAAAMQQPGMMQPGTGMMGGMQTAGVAQPGMMGAGAPMGGMAQPGMMAQPGSPVQPAQGFVQGAMQAAGIQPAFPTPGGMVQQQAQPQYQMTPKAGAYTFEQFLQNGFSVAQILQDGYAVQVA